MYEARRFLRSERILMHLSLAAGVMLSLFSARRAATAWLAIAPSITHSGATVAAPASRTTMQRTQAQGRAGLLVALGAVWGVGASSARRCSSRRTVTASKATEETKIAAAALVTSFKIQCEHPDRKPPYLCGDCPRNAACNSADVMSAAGVEGETKFASAAMVTSLKIQCEHPDRKPPYLCGDCPRNAASNCAEVSFEDEVFKFDGDSKLSSAALVTSLKLQCEHPDRKPPYLCGDCPRN